MLMFDLRALCHQQDLFWFANEVAEVDKVDMDELSVS